MPHRQDDGQVFVICHQIASDVGQPCELVTPERGRSKFFLVIAMVPLRLLLCPIVGTCTQSMMQKIADWISQLCFL